MLPRNIAKPARLRQRQPHEKRRAGVLGRDIRRALEGEPVERFMHADVQSVEPNITVRQFVEDVKKATNGQLEINVHSAGSLIKHPDILRAVSTGQVPIAEFLLGQFGNEEPVFNADNVPFLAAGYDNAWKLYQAQKPILEKHLAKRGLKLLYSVAWPGQGIYTKDPVKSAADFKGLKMRTYSPLKSAALFTGSFV